MRVATWNVNSLKARLPRVEEWLVYAEPDVLCLQETKLTDAAFPVLAFSALGYESVHFGQGQWNGVAVLSKRGIDSSVAGFDASLVPTSADDYTRSILAEARIVSANINGVTIVSVYVPNGRDIGDPHYGAKLIWLDVLAKQYAHMVSAGAPVIICGDFNIAPDDRDVWDPKKFAASTHVTAQERAKLANLEAAGFADLFRAKYQQADLFTYWDYRAGDFHKHRGMRIDLLYGSAPIAERLQWAFIDRTARKGKLPSDHTPVMVDFAWP